MAEYEEQEYLNMLYALGIAHGNPRRAVHVYAEEFTQDGDRIPDYRVIEAVPARLLQGHGLIHNHNRGVRLNLERYPLELEDLVLAQVADTPGLSTRVIATRLGLHGNHQLVDRILLDNGLHAYHFRKVQDMRQPQDGQRR